MGVTVPSCCTCVIGHLGALSMSAKNTHAGYGGGLIGLSLDAHLLDSFVLTLAASLGDLI